MKKAILFGLLLVSFVGYSQKEVKKDINNSQTVLDAKLFEPDDVIEEKEPEENDPNRIFVVVETAPEYPGGINAFREFISQNYKNPKTTRDVKGTLIIGFVIEADGSLSDIQVIRDLGFGTGKEAVRVLKKSKKWKPGVQNGRAVRVKYTLPIKIDIEAKKK